MRTRKDNAKTFNKDNATFFVEKSHVTVNDVPVRHARGVRIPYSVVWQAEQLLLSFLEEKYVDEKLISWKAYESPEKAVLLSEFQVAPACQLRK